MGTPFFLLYLLYFVFVSYIGFHSVAIPVYFMELSTSTAITYGAVFLSIILLHSIGCYYTSLLALSIHLTSAILHFGDVAFFWMEGYTRSSIGDMIDEVRMLNGYYPTHFYEDIFLRSLDFHSIIIIGIDAIACVLSFIYLTLFLIQYAKTSTSVVLPEYVEKKISKKLTAEMKKESEEFFKKVVGQMPYHGYNIQPAFSLRLKVSLYLLYFIFFFYIGFHLIVIPLFFVKLSSLAAFTYGINYLSIILLHSAGFYYTSVFAHYSHLIVMILHFGDFAFFWLDGYTRYSIGYMISEITIFAGYIPKCPYEIMDLDSNSMVIIVTDAIAGLLSAIYLTLCMRQNLRTINSLAPSKCAETKSSKFLTDELTEDDEGFFENVYGLMLYQGYKNRQVPSDSLSLRI